MTGGHLAVHAREAPALDLLDQRDEGNLRCVRHSTEHRLPEEHPAQAHAVQPADQLAVGPGLDRMGIAHVEEALVCLCHLICDPRSILAASRLGAPFHDLHEAAVQRDLQPA